MKHVPTFFLRFRHSSQAEDCPTVRVLVEGRLHVDGEDDCWLSGLASELPPGLRGCSHLSCGFPFFFVCWECMEGTAAEEGDAVGSGLSDVSRV
jgi:hypothetical protein